MNSNALRNIIGCGIAIFWAGAITFGYPGLMSTYWQETFGVGASETGLVVSIMLIALTLAMFASGPVLKKCGMSFCVIFAAICYLIAFAILFKAQNIYHVYIWAFIANFGGSFVYGPGLTTVQESMPEKRGLASGILNLVFGLSAAIMSPVLSRIMEDKGYNYVILLLVVGIALTYFASCLLLGAGAHAEKAKNAYKESDMSIRQAMETKQFWCIWLVWVFMGAAGVSMISLAKSYSVAIGASSAFLLTAFNVTNGAIRIVAGTLIDHIGGRLTGMIAISITAVGYFILPHTDNFFLAALCAMMVGIGFGTLFTITGPMVSGSFGFKNFPLIFGHVFTAYGFVAGIIGPVIAGLILSKTNDNYVVVFTYLAVMALIGAIIMSFVKSNNKSAKQNV